MIYKIKVCLIVYHIWILTATDLSLSLYYSGDKDNTSKKVLLCRFIRIVIKVTVTQVLAVYTTKTACFKIRSLILREDKIWLYFYLSHLSRARLRFAVSKKRNQWLCPDTWYAKPQSRDSLSVDENRWYREWRNTAQLCRVWRSQRTALDWL